MNRYTLTTAIALFTALSSGIIHAAAPTISEQTETVYVPTGENDVLTVESASNSGGTRTYQWYEGLAGDTASPISGAIAADYTTPTVTSATNYWLRITNNDGSVDSATMTVIPYSSAADLPRSQQMILKIPDSVGIDTSKVANKVMLYIPNTYDASSKRPLLVHLHGAGNQNDHVSGLFVNSPGSELQPENDFQFIVVRPRSNGGWNQTQLNKVLNHLKADYKVDAERVYLSGYSMGARGVWDWAINNPNTFGAVGVFAGATANLPDLAAAEAQSHIPFWILHGDQDATVNIDNAKTRTELLTQSGSEARFTVFPGYGHGISGEPAKIGDDDFLEWMKLQRRRTPATASSKVLSVNFYSAANDWQLVDGAETFGVESFGTVVGNWNNSAGTAASGLVFDDGSVSTVALTSVQPEGAKSFEAGPETALQAGISRTASTTGTVSVTLDNLNANFPSGCYAIVYLTGDKPEYSFDLDINGDPINAGKYWETTKDTLGNTAATISDGSATFYFQTPDLMDRSQVRITQASPTLQIFYYPLMRTTEQTTPTGTYPEATFAVFGPYSADSVTLSLDGVAGEDAAIGGVQLFEYTPSAPSPDPAGFVTPPSATGPTEITMSADLGSAGFGPVEYYFTETSGNFGGSDSGWQTSLSYVDDGLLPETTYSYTVTMRDALGNQTATSAPAQVATPAYDLSAPSILIGWHTPVGKNDSTPDNVRSGVTGLTSINKAIQSDYNSIDGSYGSVAIPGSPATANGYRLETNPGNETLTITINNDTGADLVLESLRFDYSRTGANAPKDLTIASSGSITADTVFSFTNNTSDENGKIGDYMDVDADLSGLSDHTLADSESATFTFTVSNAVGAFTPLAVDNIAITELPEPDSDSDGIPDAIETLWSLNNSIDDSALDKDGDGRSNLAEFVGGTAGNDPNDFLRASIVKNGTLFDISLSKETSDRQYILEYSPDLTTPWQAIDADSTLPITFQKTPVSSAEFFRIRILQTP
jgi:hypothetical protein